MFSPSQAIASYNERSERSVRSRSSRSDVRRSGSLSIRSVHDDEAHDPPGRTSSVDAAPTVEPPPPVYLDPNGGKLPPVRQMMTRAEMKRVVTKFFTFIGPGFLVAVAYIDPGNYATDVAAGASYRFALLFIVLLSNIFAIFLQSLCIKLGSVTGMDLAENCRAHLPPWLNALAFFFGEAAVIATDIAEVIGTAIALNLLSGDKIPLVAGCAISIADVFIILFFYNPKGGMRTLRVFEVGIAFLVLGVVGCFCYELTLIRDTSVGEVFRGYLPSATLSQPKAIFQAAGILGATVMPHSLYLGSGIVQVRVRQFDIASADGATRAAAAHAQYHEDVSYRPTILAIRSCLRYSIAELAIGLFTFALFVNSAILIVAGAALSDTDAQDADLFGIYDLLSTTIAPATGTLFAVGLLLSGVSAGVVCTMAGQIVGAGHLKLKWPHWVQRLFTRTIAIIPSIIIAGAIGRAGLGTALEASQVTLSVLLPFISAPVIWFTSRDKYMRVAVTSGQVIHLKGSTTSLELEETDTPEPETVSLANSWPVIIFAGLLWTFITLIDVTLIVLSGLGQN